jgi:hypothetical protein
VSGELHFFSWEWPSDQPIRVSPCMAHGRWMMARDVLLALLISSGPDETDSGLI